MRSKQGPGAVRIAYCGPIAQPGRPARGGYESANRRLIDDLRLRGIDVVEIPYAEASGREPRKVLAHVTGFARAAATLISKRREFDLLHITPLYRQFLYAEALLCAIAWTLGKRVALDIRAGSFVRNYRERSRAYRALADSLIAHAELVAVEGKEYLPFIAERRDGSVLYLPNYVQPPPAAPVPGAEARTSAVMRLVFLSRIVPEKGVETAIRTLEILTARGLPATLEVIGTGEETYVKRLITRTGDLPVIWSGALPPREVKARLATAHFFLFPTVHPGEGHSNALTEAMAEGVVPICSGNGFNPSVVGACGGILPADASAADYAEATAALWSSGSWPRLSAACRERVAQNFASNAVLAPLIEHYRQIATTL
ncbi:glycosyltransferase [Methyloceanibacter sp.]|uniref:glycosyltransferase family 4 protein n=1 Tax=Methyloceanibacter sp. TaxID=1965321 RepID=UPI002D40F535|nr:glycosyltransferase [Methyloceanibacter sp.]HZP08103.1 glycosyltransferase [Methyloceanibacter sp.]